MENNNGSFKYSQDYNENQEISRSFMNLSNNLGKPSAFRKANFKNELPSNTRFSSIFKPRISTLNNYRLSNLMEGENNGNSNFKPNISNLNNFKGSNAMEGGEIRNASLFYSKSTIVEKNFEAIQEEIPNHAKEENDGEEESQRKLNKAIKKEEMQYKFLFFDEARFLFDILYDF